MRVSTIAKGVALGSALVALVFAPAPPQTYANHLGTMSVCASEGTCCPQNTATCNAGGSDIKDNFYQATGPCKLDDND